MTKDETTKKKKNSEKHIVIDWNKKVVRREKTEKKLIAGNCACTLPTKGTKRRRTQR